MPDKPKKKNTSPTILSLRYMRSLGYIAEAVERFVRFPPPGHRKDLFGFVDIVGGGAGKTVAVQTTSDDHLRNRATKIREHENYQAVRSMGWIIEVHGWKKVGGRWRVRILDMETNSERRG